MQYYSYLVTMNARIDQLVKSLLRKESLEQCSLQEVEQFAERYPYFGAAQLLLTKKLQTENPGRYPEQLQKTHLFFHNPLWVEQLLNETGNAVVKKAEPVAETAVAETEIPTAQEIVPAIEKAAAPLPSVMDLVEEPSPATLPEETLHPGMEQVETATTVTGLAENETAVSIAEQTALAEESITPAEEAIVPAEMNSVKEEGQPEFNPGMPDAVTGNELVFEPYHTIDYFASQGIKFREEEVPKDKFSQQLKSFTGWLRTLKKLPLAEINKAPVSFGEHKVEQLAEHSLQEGDVVTETMAEVWEKQGNYSRAREIYSKLSLLEPAKSTYFAAKIEELKKLI